MAATLLALTPLCSLAENEISDNDPYNNPDSETAGYTLRAKGDSKLMQQMQPTIKFGGNIMGKYRISDRSGQNTKGEFNLRKIFLKANRHFNKD